jgi:hypothetical protein
VLGQKEGMESIKIKNHRTKELTGHDKAVPVIPGVRRERLFEHKQSNKMRKDNEKEITTKRLYLYRMV